MGKNVARKKAVAGSVRARRHVAESELPAGYDDVLANMTRLITESRRRAAATVNRELVLLYWQIGAVIVKQQETADWGDSIVEQFGRDLRTAFPEMKGFSLPNLWKMRQFCLACREIDEWLSKSGKLSTLSREISGESDTHAIVETVSREIHSPGLACLMTGLSWSQLNQITTSCSHPAERYFYMKMSIRERWSVRELRRQIESDLFTRYVSVRDEPEKCLVNDAESGPLLPFKDHYVLEFLGLEEEHSEQELRHAILANLRDFFLEFGRDLTFVGEEYPLTVGSDTFRIDLLFFHRWLQCLIAIDLKKGPFKPEYVGKSCFYCAALDEQIRLPHENPSFGLVLCKSADQVQVRLALSAAAEQVGVATYRTALPDESLIQKRLEQLGSLSDSDD
jgi:predicted nuclease of restriction endonuclease-like (RecB) superfamily